MSLRLNPALLLVTALAPASVAALAALAAPLAATPVNPASANQALATPNASATRTVLNTQQLHQQIQNNTARLEQLEQANLDALARNQELQLLNDNLSVQVQVLQSERSAQMFLYGAATLVVGALMGFILANYILSRRPRRW